MRASRPTRSKLASLFRTIFYALLIAFAIGIVIGTLLRQRLERPTRYIGANDSIESATDQAS